MKPPNPTRAGGRVVDASELSRRLDQAAEAFAAGRLEEAARAYRAAERLAPQDIRAPYSLAVIDLRCGRWMSAMARLQAVLARAPEHVPALHNLGTAAQQLGRWSAAAEAYARALALGPEAVETRRALATALAVLGDARGAIEQHRRLAADPALRWPSLTRIALLDPAAIDAAELADMRRAADDRSIDQETRTGLWFALGEALDRRGLGEAAFAAFAAGNRLKRAALEETAPPDQVAQAHQAAADYVLRRYSPAFLAANAGKGARSDRPIFIVGFPRSGSTLIEQILASHPCVQGLGETGVLPALLDEAYPSGPRPAAAAFRGLADRYLNAMRARDWDGRSRFVDKTLENYLHVGLIHVMFPRALVVHAVRDPMDACVSCFRQLFARGNETLYGLADIALEHRRYRALMDHWRAVLPDRIVDVEYEALVADPEREIRALTEAAGLPWDPAVLRFFERAGPVATASAAQVRQPIYQTSVQRWRAYAHHLHPLAEALAATAPPD